MSSSVVDLRPVQDPLAVRQGVGHLARVGAGGDQHGVGDQPLGRAVGGGDRDLARAVRRLPGLQPAAAAQHPAAGAGDGGGDVVGLGQRQPLDPSVDLAEVDPDDPGRMVRVRGAVLDDDAQLLVGGVEGGHHLGRGDERLRRDAVGQHRRPAQTVAVDDGHLRAERGRHQGCFVSAGSTTDDHDPSHVLHCPARPSVALPRGRAAPWHGRRACALPRPRTNLRYHEPNGEPPVPSEACRSTPRTPATSTRG